MVLISVHAVKLSHLRATWQQVQSILLLFGLNAHLILADCDQQFVVIMSYFISSLKSVFQILMV